jgi:peptide/nickel transport system permease protein
VSDSTATTISDADQNSMSQTALAFRRLRRHRLAMTGGLILIVLYTTALFADFLSPYAYDDQNSRKSYHPPTSFHLIDADGNWHLWPFVYDTTVKIDPVMFSRSFIEDTSRSYPVTIFAKSTPYDLLGLIPMERRLFGLPSETLGMDAPPRIFLFGSDLLGRDIFTRILHGARISLSIGLVGVMITFAIGMVIGGIAGYFGGKLDNVLMRVSEVFMMIPGLYLMLALRAAFPLSMSSVQIYLMIIVILSFISWAGFARVIRGIVLSLRAQDFVQGAQALGAGTGRIIIRHILPNTFSFAIISATLSIPGYILMESALSVLGLGIREPQASWGNMLNAAMNASVMQQAPWILIPGVFIFVAIMAFNFLGDGLRDALDPKGQY